MKTSTRSFCLAAAVSGLLAAVVSCNKLPSEGGQGTLRWAFSSGILSRSPVDMPDTDSFILTVMNSANTILYKGYYGDSPESMLVNPGSYTVRAVSREFEEPEFDAPQFGDEQVVVVKAGTDTDVLLDCAQMNCGLRLRIDPNFGTAYPEGSLTVTSAEGSLAYGLSETRTGFFRPGSVSVILKEGTSSQTLVTKNLEAREILSLGITCPSSTGTSADGGSSISIRVDTLRTWTEEEYTIGSGQGDPGVSSSEAYSVSQAKEHAGEKGVWVCGYIVGGDLSSSKNGIKFEPPFESMTCIAIASRSSVSEKSSCMSVQLVKGDFREALNLVEHPELIGRKVYLKGDIEASYYGIPGLKNLTGYSFN